MMQLAKGKDMNSLDSKADGKIDSNDHVAQRGAAGDGPGNF